MNSVSLVDGHIDEVVHKEDKLPIAVGSIKIKNGSKLVIGGELSQVQIVVHQRFNCFQKLMWKVCFGVVIEDYNED